MPSRRRKDAVRRGAKLPPAGILRGFDARLAQQQRQSGGRGSDEGQNRKPLKIAVSVLSPDGTKTGHKLEPAVETQFSIRSYCYRFRMLHGGMGGIT
jgi:hypothetical protein